MPPETLHPAEIPALVDALEAKIASEPRSDRDKALDEAIAEIRTVRDEWAGPMWGGVRAIFDAAIDRIDRIR